MKVIFRIVFSLAVLMILVIGGLVGYLAISEYKPDPVLPIQIQAHQNDVFSSDNELTITSFNIGYCALDQDSDFFMDGGTGSRGISAERVKDNLTGIINFLKQQNADIYLIQEVDEKSTRSYLINQHEQITQSLTNYNSSFAINYLVGWVPVPLSKPMGRVRSGMLTLSRFAVHEAWRYTLPGEYSWPTRLAQLDRCLLESRIPLDNGKELVIGHIHLSAYDQGGFIRNQQTVFLEEYARNEYAKGNYIILGGDWNHLLAEKPEEKRARHSANWPNWLQLLPKDFLNEFQWVFDETIPSNRSVEAPYNPNTSFVTNIDGFLVSPNIKVVQVQGHDLGFRFSDHNPVTATFKLDKTPPTETLIESEDADA